MVSLSCRFSCSLSHFSTSPRRKCRIYIEQYFSGLAAEIPLVALVSQSLMLFSSKLVPRPIQVYRAHRGDELHQILKKQ